jgi:hypothetical protein
VRGDELAEFLAVGELEEMDCSGRRDSDEMTGFTREEQSGEARLLVIGFVGIRVESVEGFRFIREVPHGDRARGRRCGEELPIR